MTQTNSLGIRVVGGVIIGAIIVLGVSKLGIAGFSYKAVTAPSPTPDHAPTLPSSAPTISLTPELAQKFSDLAKNNAEKVGPETKKYVESLPKEATQTQVLGANTVSNYIDNNKGQLLQDLPTGLLKTSSSTGKATVKTYLDTISYTQNKKLQNITGDSIITAFQRQESGEDSNALAPVLASIQSNYDILKAIIAPKEAADIQTKLLQATYAL
ncbi:MAG: hypothetical protein ABIP54_02515, partial [Candidatus Andersenbacteria bacterium]